MTPPEQIAAWRNEGADRFDRVRFRMLEAMAARTAGYNGAARRLLDDKLAHRTAAYAALVANPPAPPVEPLAGNARSPLAQLLDRFADHQAGAGGTDAMAPSATPESSPIPELKAIRQFRGTWSRLRADRSLMQSRSTMPDNAGPLNSHHLVHRSLRLMHAASPDYLNRFMAYVNALAELEQLASPAAPMASAKPPRAAVPRKAGRSKSA